MAKKEYPGLKDVYDSASMYNKKVEVSFFKSGTRGIYEVRVTLDGDALMGPWYFSFDKKRIFNYWSDYPDKLTPEQIKLFNKYNPLLAEMRDYGGYPPEDESETD